MKNKFILLALIVAITFVFLSMASFAEEQEAPTGKPGESFYFPGQDQRPSGESYRHPQQGSGFRKMMDLELSEEQITEIRKIMLDFQKDSGAKQSNTGKKVRVSGTAAGVYHKYG